MTQVSIRDLTHGFSKYLKVVKRGERLVILERNKPIADIIPHNENILYPGWKRPIKLAKVKGSLSKLVVQMRKEARY